MSASRNTDDPFNSWHADETHPTAARIQAQSQEASSRTKVIRPQSLHPSSSNLSPLTTSYSPSPSQARSTSRLSYSEHLQQHHAPSVSSQQLYADPSPSLSRIAPPTEEEDESIGLLLGASKRRRGRKDSYSSYGSSVLPAGLTVPDNGSFVSRHNFRGSGSKRHGFPAAVAESTPRPFSLEIQGWLRHNDPAEGQIVPSASFQSFAPTGRVRRMGSGIAFSETGSANGRDGPPSASGLSAGIMSAGGEDRRARRKASSSRREGSGVSALEDAAHPVARSGKEFGIEAESRRIDSVEEWRAKSAGNLLPAAEAGTTNSLQTLLDATGARQWKKSFSKRNGERSRTAAEPMPSLSGALSAAGRSAKMPSSVTSTHRRKRSFSKAPSIAGSVTQSILSSRPLPDLLALSGLKSQQDTPIRQFVRWMTREGLRHLVLPVMLLSVLLVKWTVGRGGWSGRATPPMHGDFEAQRHWIELTLHLPTSQWYFYDLQYWGLDYPPLTAWFSLACGKVAQRIPSLQSSLSLFSSRGNEDPTTLAFMRSTVLFFDYTIYIPSIFFFLSKKLEGRGSKTFAISLLSILMQPSLILIDNGHFQYNSIMLGFATASFGLLYTTLPNPGAETDRITDLSRKLSYQYVLAAIFFCLALSFKQMALYYAPAVFAVMLGRCLGLDTERGMALFCGLGFTVLLTFGVIFSPWLTSLDQLVQLVHRIFPLARGLFEDKVSNVWCFLSVLPLPQRWKLRNLLETQALAKLSLATTVVMILPSCVLLFRAAKETAKREMMSPDIKVSSNKTFTEKNVASTLPSPAADMLPYGLLSTSMAFFLFGFQTHEKSILLPLLPITLLLGAKGDQWGGGSTATDWEWGLLANNTAVFSLWPLLKKDDQGVAYLILPILWNWMVGSNPLKLRRSFVGIVTFTSTYAFLFLHLFEFLLPPLARYPDIDPVLTVLSTTPIFFLIYAWALKRQLEINFAQSLGSR